MTMKHVKNPTRLRNTVCPCTIREPDKGIQSTQNFPYFHNYAFTTDRPTDQTKPNQPTNQLRGAESLRN